MFDKLIQFSLNRRLVVLISAVLLLILGTYITLDLPVDVFPDLTAPTVTIITEAHGMAAEGRSRENHRTDDSVLRSLKTSGRKQRLSGAGEATGDGAEAPHRGRDVRCD